MQVAARHYRCTIAKRHSLVSGEMPYAQTWCSKKPNSVGPIMMPYSAKRVKRNLKCFLCERCSGLVTNKSSKYTNTKSSPRVTWSIKRWKVWLEFPKPNGVLVKLNRPKGVVTAVLCMSDGSTGIWLYVRIHFFLEKTFDPAKRWVKTCIWGIGYRSGTVWAFKLF